MPDKKKSQKPKQKSKATELDEKSLDKVAGGALRRTTTVKATRKGGSVYEDPCAGGE
jgi:hypothetical protein